MMSGGVNLRYIRDNIADLVLERINANGWNDDNRHNQPVRVVTSPLDNDEEVDPNIISVVTEDIRHRDVEVGSNLTDQIVTIAIDVIGEDQSIGLHLAGDVLALCQGLYNIPITDREPSPTTLFRCDIEGVFQERNRFYETKSKKYWWVISFNAIRTEFAEAL